MKFMNNKIGNYQVLKSYLKYTIQKQMKIDEIILNLREFGSPYIYESNVGKNIFFVIKQFMGLFLVIDFGTMIGILGIYFSIFAPFYLNFLDIFN